jgi:hypothetical protein
MPGGGRAEAIAALKAATAVRCSRLIIIPCRQLLLKRVRFWQETRTAKLLIWPVFCKMHELCMSLKAYVGEPIQYIFLQQRSRGTAHPFPRLCVLVRVLYRQSGEAWSGGVKSRGRSTSAAPSRVY